MNLKSILAPGDLFVSYWLDRNLTVIVGDRQQIHAVNTVQVHGLQELILDFEVMVTHPDHYANFIAEEFRPSAWASALPLHQAMPGMLKRLGSFLVTPAFKESIQSGKYQRLLVFPDGLLNALPVHHAVDSALGETWSRSLPGGVVYAPSASTYTYACVKRQKGMPKRAVILVGDDQDPGLVLEAEHVAHKMPCPVDTLTRMEDFKKLSKEADILYVATHGQSPESFGSTVLSQKAAGSTWSLLFDRQQLNSANFFSDEIRLPQGAVVVLSACSVGRVMAGPVHEVAGMVHALFYAGAATVLAARWPVFYQSAESVFGGVIKRVFADQVSISAALHAAIQDAIQQPAICQYMAGPEAHTFFWGPFALFGCGD